MENHIIPSEIREKITELGFFPVSLVSLYELWSVVGIRDEDHYNIQLSKTNLAVVSINHLQYRWNATGAKILSVKRVLVGGQLYSDRERAKLDRQQ